MRVEVSPTPRPAGNLDDLDYELDRSLKELKFHGQETLKGLLARVLSSHGRMSSKASPISGGFDQVDGWYRSVNGYLFSYDERYSRQ